MSDVKQKPTKPRRVLLRVRSYVASHCLSLWRIKESIVLVTHYRNVGAENGVNSGLSYGLALLKYLSRAKWLAKDVILLASDDDVLDGSDGYAPGTEAWLQAYHLDPVNSGLQGVLPMRAGVIRAAINLETMLDSRQANAVGIYTAGPHANFISYNIDSITLSLTKRVASGDRPLAPRDVLRSIEMVVRALSNLEEKLHQSFFLYVLPNTSTFVSVVFRYSNCVATNLQLQ
eukprot:jgi/Phyca11/14261/fgenesh1_pg.PHYCAscaffold_6_\